MSEQGEQAPTGKMDITIQNLGFECAAPYAEGHVLTGPEASVLNQTRAENLRNNFASVIKGKLKALSEEEPPRSELTEDEIADLREQFASYENEYEFQGKRTSRAPIDPVKREANKMAKDAINAALRERNINPKDLVAGKMEELISQYLAKNPDVLEEAKRRVENVKQAANAALDGVDLEGAVKEADEAQPEA
jgi:hypothetical protein